MWILLALGASAFWGLSYTLSEQIYKKISVPTSLAIGSLVIFIITLSISLFSHNLKPDLLAIASSRKLLLFVVLGIVALLAAELLIGSSITIKNATLSGLIEISYPIFIALFSIVLFKSNYLNLPTIIGGITIFTGIFIIYFFNK